MRRFLPSFVALLVFLLMSGCSEGVRQMDSVSNGERSRGELRGEGQVQRGQADEIVAAFLKQYTPVFRQRNLTLQILNQWNDRTINAFTAQVRHEGSDYAVVMLKGGLTRHHAMTADALRFVICHELGHHLAGYPKNPEPALRWSSAEGQSDYYAALKCLRNMLALDKSMPDLETPFLPEAVRTDCRSHFAQDEGYQICLRAARAVVDAMRVVYYVEHGKDPPSEELFFATISRAVRSTLIDYPSHACRVSTVVEGTLCPVPISAGMSDTDETVGTCHEVHEHERGKRPRCWFKPRITQSDKEESVVALKPQLKTVQNLSEAERYTGCRWLKHSHAQ